MPWELDLHDYESPSFINDVLGLYLEKQQINDAEICQINTIDAEVF